MDSIHITALTINTRIGIHLWEQRILQPLLLDIHIPIDLSACEDNINNTLDYDKICQFVTSYVTSKSFQLIETVANEVAIGIKKEFNLSQITVTVSKPHAVKNGNISVTVNR